MSGCRISAKFAAVAHAMNYCRCGDGDVTLPVCDNDPFWSIFIDDEFKTHACSDCVGDIIKKYSNEFPPKNTDENGGRGGSTPASAAPDSIPASAEKVADPSSDR